MASEINSPARPAVTASTRQAAKVKSYVNQQLEKTRKQVKTIDFISGALVLVAFTVGFLLFAAMVDAWIWPLSRLGRWAFLLFWLGSCLGYTAISIVPLLIKRINTDYAAKMIEEAKPSFSNSLMNYVSLRKRPKGIRPAVLDAVSRQAATDLASVPGDAAVDQSKMIRIGFVLVGLTLLAVGYKVLSPKDPLSTVARIFAPASDISQPAVVTIEEVLPGDVEIFFGEILEVTARVSGRHQPEDVNLIYSTIDGQLVDQPLSMKPTGDPRTYGGTIAMPGGGVQASLKYRVVAKDGVSRDYVVAVRPNPTIAIESLLFDPPDYTGLASRTLMGVGDIDAIEGTLVTINAIANLPIKSAEVELLNEVVNSSGDTELSYEKRFVPAVGSKYIMDVDGRAATQSILIKLDANREKPFATHYRLKFTSIDGDRNSQPNVYPIRVTPDLAPDVEIKNPVETDGQIPQNQVLAIDVVASDLDFSIDSVELSVDHNGRSLFSDGLSLNSNKGNRRVTARYLLNPIALGLKPGDVAVFHAIAKDNRVQGRKPDPNISRTQNYSVTIQHPEEKSSEPVAKNPDGEGQSGEGQDGEGQDGEGQDGEGQDGEGQSGEGQDGEGHNGEGQDGEGQDGEGQDGEGQDGEGQDGEGQDGEGQDGEGQDGEGQDGEGQSGEGQSGEGQSGEGQSGEGQSGEGQGGEGQGGEGQSGEGQSGEGQSGEGQGGEGQGGEGQSGEGQGGEGQGGEDGQRDSSLTGGSQTRMSKNASDGERMRKLQEFLNEQESRKPEDGFSKNGNNDMNDDTGSSKSVSKNPDGEGQGGEGQGGEGQSGEGQSGEGQSGEGQSGEGQSGEGQDGEGQDGEGQDGEGQDGEGQDGEGQDGEGQDGEGQDGEGQDGEGQDGEGQSGEGQSGEGQSGEGQSGEGQSGEGQDGEGPSGEGQSGEGQSGEGQSGEGQSGEGQSGEGQDGEGQDGEGQSGEGQSGEGQSGEGQSGEGQSGEGQSGEGQSGEGQSGEGQSGEGQSGEGQSGEGQSGEGQSGEGQSGEGQSGEGQSGEGQSGEGDQSGSSGSEMSSRQTKGSPSGESNPSASGDGQNSSAMGTGAGGGTPQGELLERDRTNYEHAKKATDMVLKKLSDQRYDPDPELLDKMNWTKADLENFLRRWEEMKDAADTGTPESKKKYEKSLRSLGLRPKSTSRKTKTVDESAEGLGQDSAVNRPPAERVPDFNSFMRDLNRAKDN